MIWHVAVELKSGSMTVIEPMTAPGGLFSARVVEVRRISVGASFTSEKGGRGLVQQIKVKTAGRK